MSEKSKSASSYGARPAIWVTGRQHAAFDLRNFLTASIGFARDAVAGLLMRCASSALGAAQALRAGRLRVPKDRLGHTGRWLPSAESTGQALEGGVAILAKAAHTAAQGRQHMAQVAMPGATDHKEQDGMAPPAGATASRRIDAAPLHAANGASGDEKKHGDATGIWPEFPVDDAADSIAESLRAMIAAENHHIQATQPYAPDLDRPGAVKDGFGGHRSGSGNTTHPDSAAPLSDNPPSLPRRLTRRIGKAGAGAVRACGNALSRALGIALAYWLVLLAIPYGMLVAGLDYLNGRDLDDDQ